MQFDHHLYCAEAHSGGDKVRRAEVNFTVQNTGYLCACSLKILAVPWTHFFVL